MRGGGSERVGKADNSVGDDSVHDLTDSDKYMQMQFFMVNKIKQENDEQRKNYEEQEKAILDKEVGR